jgi:hypothetical protein
MFKKPRAIVSIAAGKSQLIIIKKAREMGFAVIGIDRNSKAPGFEFCTDRIILSTYDSNPIIDKISGLQSKYDILGVINRSSGPPVVTCANLCNYLSLPGVKPKVAKNIIDKTKLKRECCRLGIPTPHGQYAQKITDIKLSDISFPCAVKPALSIIGKSGVSIISKSDEIPNAFAEAKINSFNGCVMFEEFVPGNDVSLMGIVQKGLLFPITLIDEINITDDRGHVYGAGSAIPSVFSGKKEENDIISLAQNIVKAFSLNTTFFNISCRLMPGMKAKLIEIHLDLGGDLVLDELIPASTKYDILKLAINRLTGCPVNLDRIAFKPAGIIYEKTEKLISQCSFKILQADNYDDFKKLINSEMARRVNAFNNYKR